MRERYVLLKELAPAEHSKPYLVARIAPDGKTLDYLVWCETEDTARICHHVALFGAL